MLNTSSPPIALSEAVDAVAEIVEFQLSE